MNAIFKSTIAAISAAIFSTAGAALAKSSETYVLVHALGNTEKVVAKNLSKAECDQQKAEYKKVAEALGTYNERSGKGSVTCLPSSIMD